MEKRFVRIFGRELRRIHAVRKDKTRLSVPAVMMMRQRCGYLHCNHEQKHRPDEYVPARKNHTSANIRILFYSIECEPSLYNHGVPEHGRRSCRVFPTRGFCRVKETDKRRRGSYLLKMCETIFSVAPLFCLMYSPARSPCRFLRFSSSCSAENHSSICL